MNNPVVYTPRIQRLASPLHVGIEISLYDKNTYVHYWVNGVHKHKAINPNDVEDLLRRAEAKNEGAFFSGPIPCNNNQHGVFAFATSGITRECALRKNECALIGKAFDSFYGIKSVEVKPTLTNKKPAEPVVVQQIVKPEPEYEENIAELEAMKECFAPACDYVVDEPEGYVYGGPGEYDDMVEYDDMPE